ncbi:MAG: hypothetical protein ACK5YZ_02375 [bacterium]|jgi:hypothetical protein
MVASQALKEVIWQGRNHALHWEEGNPHAPVQRCLDMLATDFGPHLTGYRTKNLAFEIIEALGWTSFDAFRNDLLTL